MSHKRGEPLAAQVLGYALELRAQTLDLLFLLLTAQLKLLHLRFALHTRPLGGSAVLDEPSARLFVDCLEVKRRNPRRARARGSSPPFFCVAIR